MLNTIRHLPRWAAAVLLLTAAAAAPAAGAEASLDDLLTVPEVWTDGADEFMLRYAPLRFGFVSGRSVARAATPTLSFKGLRVWEALAYFDGGAVSRVELSLYNRGDAGDLTQEAFEALVKRVQTTLVVWGGNGLSGQTTSERANQYTKRHAWARAPAAVQLDWAYSEGRRTAGAVVPFRPEFIRLRLSHARHSGMASAAAGGSMLQNVAVSGLTLRQNVKRGDGDVWIGAVPMVDQGQKGYCAAATSERLMRYYGRTVDQHDIAQLADTASEGGTSTDGMLNALRRIGRNYQLDVRALYDMDVRDLVRMIDDYNQQARSKGQAAIEYGRVIDTGAVFGAMDASLLKKTRTRRSQDVASFQRDIRTYVDAGVPLIWACIVGKYPENPPIHDSGAYGHMRMVIGYNPKTEEILYTDTWGPGHELKRMPAADAWSMSMGLYVVKPRDIR